MRSLLLNFAVSVLVGIGCFSLGEVAIRLLHRAPPVYRFNAGTKESAYRLSENPILGYEFREKFQSNRPDSHQTFDFINSYGQRDIEHTITGASGIERIALVGDSVVAGNGIRSVRETLARQTEEALGTKFEVFGFGVGGYCTLAEVELLRVRALAFKPHIVVLVFVENDFINMNSEMARDLAFERPVIARELFVQSELFRLAALRWNLFHFAQDSQPEFGLVRNIDAVGTNNVERGLAQFASLAASNSFQPIIVVWPHFDDDSINDRLQAVAPDSTNRLLVEHYAAKFHIPIYRLTPLFQKDFEERKDSVRKRAGTPSPRRLYTIGDGVHPNRIGAKAGGKVIAEVVLGEREELGDRAPFSERFEDRP